MEATPSVFRFPKRWLTNSDAHWQISRPCLVTLAASLVERAVIDAVASLRASHSIVSFTRRSLGWTWEPATGTSRAAHGRVSSTGAIERVFVRHAVDSLIR